MKEQKELRKHYLSGEQQDKGNKYYRVADVLSDLMHYCDKNNIDWYNEVNYANLFYNEDNDLEEVEDWKEIKYAYTSKFTIK